MSSSRKSTHYALGKDYQQTPDSTMLTILSLIIIRVAIKKPQMQGLFYGNTVKTL